MNLKSLKKQFDHELTDNILNFWVKEVYDVNRKTFIGRITNDGEKFPEAPLSAVFVSRIMWFFSAVYGVYPTALCRKIADEAFRILIDTFWDTENGGLFWSVYPNGKPQDTKKQFYAEAFFIYALTEYDLAFGDAKAKQLAESMFALMEKHSYDPEFGGYLEAKTADWKDTDDLRLGPSNSNVKKSMNTHLHILEAYTNYCRIPGNDHAKDQLEKLIRIFLDKIMDKNTGHLILFFDKDWTVRSEIDSYGHDIEWTWLICEAAEVLGKKEIIDEVENSILKTLEVTISEGLAPHGGLYYEKQEGNLQEQFDWWPQAETVVGFFNAWEILNNDKYLDITEKSWKFIQDHIIDKKYGEWFWGLNANLEPLNNDKINGWKAPYHNGRMCLEMMRRIDKYL